MLEILAKIMNFYKKAVSAMLNKFLHLEYRFLLLFSSFLR